MYKVFNPKFIIVLLAILLCLSGAFFYQLLSIKVVNAYMTPTICTVNDSIQYADSTRGASKWLWEFGDGSRSELQNGYYKPKHTGTISVRLTIDNKLNKYFSINVNEYYAHTNDNIITMEAPATVFEGEYIATTGHGNATEWRWEFGETGRIDSRDKNAIYKYNMPGDYVILLSTETTEYPIQQSIHVIPSKITDTTDVNLITENDIKEKLQAIANGQPFNSNYNHILQKYLNNNPDIQVVVNNSKGGNSFWSYCQGLKIVGHKETKIKSVIADRKEDSDVISRLIVIQTNSND